MPQFGVIFDLDGVLVDTAEFHYQAWQRLADRLGVPFGRPANEALRGVDRKHSLLLLLGEYAGRYSDAEKEAFCTEKNADYVQLIGGITPADLLPGAQELLVALHEAKIPVAVASSSKNAPAVIQLLGISGFLATVVDGNDVLRAKPDPSLFLLAAERLDCMPERCVVVEDAEAGVEAALRGGMYAIGIGDPARVGAAHRVVPSVAGITVSMLQELLLTPVAG
ncbi:MAG: beta-phosphoglucomutase [Armatimonadota bacterium]